MSTICLCIVCMQILFKVQFSSLLIQNMKYSREIIMTKSLFKFYLNYAFHAYEPTLMWQVS